jgi:hypothetical protein
MLIFEPLKNMRITILQKLPTLYIDYILPVDFMTITQYHDYLYENITVLTVALATHLTALRDSDRPPFDNGVLSLIGSFDEKKSGQVEFLLEKSKPWV